MYSFGMFVKNIETAEIMKDLIKFLMTKILFPFRNNFILFDVKRKALDRRVNIDYWSRTPNLGDAISPIIVDYVLSKRNLNIDKVVSGKKHLSAIGSTLTAGIQDCCVWGSGVANIKCSYRLKNRKLDIRSVRGPLTRLALMEYGYDCPEVYGDPGVLLKKIYNPEVKVKHRFGLIIHVSEKRKNIKNIDEDVILIDIGTTDYKKFVRMIKSVETVISSSLHGIILAETYGVRSILLKPEKDLFKYYDWYYSTGRYSFPIADSIEQAYNIMPVELPELDRMEKNIMNSFPFDLYENG